MALCTYVPYQRNFMVFLKTECKEFVVIYKLGQALKMEKKWQNSWWYINLKTNDRREYLKWLMFYYNLWIFWKKLWAVPKPCPLVIIVLIHSVRFFCCLKVAKRPTLYRYVQKSGELWKVPTLPLCTVRYSTRAIV